MFKTKKKLLISFICAAILLIVGIVLLGQPQNTLAFSTNSSSYTPSYSTNSSSYTPTYSTNSSSYTPSYSTNSSSYTPTYSTNSSNYYEEDWLSCGFVGCQTAYTYTYTPTCTSCTPTCTGKTCSQLGYQCGSWNNGCGTIIYCGSCGANQICSGGKCINISTCQPTTCSALGYQCGSWSDGCGGTLNCGTCAANQTCQSGHCVSTCTDQCQNGQRQCVDGGYRVCGNYDNSGCLIWSNIFYCSSGTYCENGYCKGYANLAVSLDADPNSGCAPLRNVSLRAVVSGLNYTNNYNDLIYRFDCGNGGGWDKTVTAQDNEVIVNDLCNYSRPGSYTARVEVQYNGRTYTASDNINVRNCEPIYQPVITPVNIVPFVVPSAPASLTIQKLAANVSNGSAYQTAVTAAPGDIVSFKIIVSSTGCGNVIVNDQLPAGLINPRDFLIDGQPLDSSLISGGVNIGNLPAGVQKTITFSASVAPAANFAFGQNTLTNTATARTDAASNSSNATVYVWRQAIAGATKVSTGIDDNPLVQCLSIAAIAAVILLGGWAAKSKKFNFKQLNNAYSFKNHSAKELEKKIAEIKAKSKI